MENVWLFAIAVFTGFFAINSPIGNIPVFISLTKQADRKTRKNISKKATFTARKQFLVNFAVSASSVEQK